MKTSVINYRYDLDFIHFWKTLTEPLLRALRHLTSETRLSDPVNVELRRRGGLELAARMLLQVWTAWPVVKAACDLVRNLVAWEDNQMVLVDLKVIPRLGQILALSVKEDSRARRVIHNFPFHFGS